jgi:AcrR family transcriptional regulator
MEELGAYKVEKSGSRRSSVERREEILEVALSVLAERGYRGASMREIAERAQASKETLYSWFGKKRELFEELVGWQAERVDAVIAPNLERDGEDPSEVLRGFALELQRQLLGERSEDGGLPRRTAGARTAPLRRGGGGDRYPHRVGHRRPTGASIARGVANARTRADRSARREGGGAVSHAVRSRTLHSIMASCAGKEES